MAIKLFKDRKSVIVRVWATPGAPETIPKGGRWGAKPPPFGRLSRAPGAAQTPKMTDFQSLKNCSREKPLGATLSQ